MKQSNKPLSSDQLIEQISHHLENRINKNSELRAIYKEALTQYRQTSSAIHGKPLSSDEINAQILHKMKERIKNNPELRDLYTKACIKM